MEIFNRLKEAQPTHSTVAWAAGGAAVLTMVVGFTLGGWVTGGTAEKMASEAATEARSTLAASLCVENFSLTENARIDHTELASLRGMRQRQFVEQADWSKMPGGQDIDRRSAELCSQQILALDIDELPLPIAASSDAAAETSIQ